LTTEYTRMYVRGPRSNGRGYREWGWVCPTCLAKGSDPDPEGAGREEPDDMGIPVVLVD